MKLGHSGGSSVGINTVDSGFLGLLSVGADYAEANYDVLKYKDVEPTLKIKEVDGLELVKKFSEEMESMLRRKVEAVENQVIL
uniref:Uncharacterized protein n=1 Tax=Sphaerodactylus townsendi TaxID=933632 RepID=A0ACB8FMV3_9SAUR